jgi:hypothetical protein
MTERKPPSLSRELSLSTLLGTIRESLVQSNAA